MTVSNAVDHGMTYAINYMEFFMQVIEFLDDLVGGFELLSLEL